MHRLPDYTQLSHSLREEASTSAFLGVYYIVIITLQPSTRQQPLLWPFLTRKFSRVEDLDVKKQHYNRMEWWLDEARWVYVGLPPVGFLSVVELPLLSCRPSVDLTGCRRGFLYESPLTKHFSSPFRSTFYPFFTLTETCASTWVYYI